MPLAIPHLTNNRVRLWLLACILIISVSLLTRIVLVVKSVSQLDLSVVNVGGIFIVGFLFDLINAMYFVIPFTIYLWLIPDQVFNRPQHRYATVVWLFILLAALLLNAVSEFLFWDEFNVRFNFIAVDYLVYTTEVIGNINQSYPMTWIIAGILVTSLIATILIARNLLLNHARTSFRRRTIYFLIYLSILLISYQGISRDLRSFSKNTYVNELAGNGLYELFAAYLNNELDYPKFYKNIPEDDAFKVVHNMMSTPDAEWVSSGPGIEREIIGAGQEKKLNVVLISVESFSAEFMELFGNKKHLTPFLDSISQHSLVFTNLFATGTRTVRGLEALSLCVPPTPGQSIVRRPHNEHLFSLGKVFHDKGYVCEYIYGGYGYFDNMNYFFENNEYDVVDRTSIDDDDIHYENIWGVADEDLFTLTNRQINLIPKDRPFFVHAMTTSNHRPFTYPDGRIDIPSHTGREGAVKYTDYAIGQFIRKASQEDWFQNTVFIVVADHCASSAGKTELPINKYHIPMLVYSPDHVHPAVMSRLMSQIDIGPTLLGMLNFSYTSKFFGYDMFKLPPGRERAFISTYQSLGYLKDRRLVILLPQKKVSSFELSDNYEPTKEIKDEDLTMEAIAWYQTASYSFSHGLMKQSEDQSSLE